MKLNNKLTKKTYGNLMWIELIFGRKINYITIIFYMLIFQVIYSIAKFGQIKTNLPKLGLLCLVLMGMKIEILITHYRAMKNKIYFDKESIISIDENKIKISNGQEEKIFTWENVNKVCENKKWYFIYIKGNEFLPLAKKSIPLEDNNILENYFNNQKSVKKMYRKWVVLILFIAVTAVGIYKVGTCAVNFNGKLSWKLIELKTDKTIKLRNDNFYSSGLEGILKEVSDKVNLEPNLMTDSLQINFEPDGTIKTIDTYIYGYDKDYKLAKGYLLYYDKNKSNKLTIHIQNWDNKGTKKYNAENDIKILVNILKLIPVKEEVSKWQGNKFGVLYKGIRSFGYNLEGIRYIDKNGEITIPEVAREEIIGPAVSVYSPGNENTIIPHRFVYKK